ncbi:MAG: LysR family transcriptional regulator [Steroidobacteraceae bacterium]
MNNYGDIVAFIRVVEAKSFVAAADTLGMSQSAMSKAVTRLEERLGARLLNRTTRSLSLTDHGRAFYERCRDAFNRLDEAESELAEARGAARGRLRLDVPLSLGRLVLVPALPRFLEQYPEISLQLSMTDQTPDIVAAGFDAAIRIGNLSDSTLVARRVANLRGVTCASPEFLADVGVPPTPMDLDPTHCIGLFKVGTGQFREWIFRKQGQQHVITPAHRLSFSDPESASSAAVSGAGFIRVLRFSVEVHIGAGLLRPVLEDWNEGAYWPVSVVYPRDRQPAARLKAFIDFLAGLFPNTVAGE